MKQKYSRRGMARGLLAVGGVAMMVAGATGTGAYAGDAPAIPKPYPLLNPPQGVTPEVTRGPYGKQEFTITPRAWSWSPAERTAYEQRVKWFHDAKFGLFFCYLSFGEALNNFPAPGFQWTTEKWNEWVDAVDVEKVADQAKELGAGYIILTLGQNHRYSCAPNPVLEELWGLKPGQYTSRRDLPMDLGKALEKRGIALMLYISADSQYRLPEPAGWKTGDRFNNWVKVCQWYSDHYGKICRGWWIDGDTSVWPGYTASVMNACRHGNPDALVSHAFALSDFIHGHCHYDWGKQLAVKPYWGRWDPEYKIQYHVLQHLGADWGGSGAHKKTEELVKYASDVVKGGGVISFDIGMYRADRKGPYLEIQPDQFAQLKAVSAALKDIPASDGSGK